MIVHNSYQEHGGEDVVVESEEKLLQAHGHEVRRHSASNAVIASTISRVAAAWRVTYSSVERDRLARQIAEWHPDIVHVHNFFPLLSPSIYDACIEASVPVVQTLHNFRIFCPGATLYREGNVCEKCLKGSPWWSAWHACYRGSHIGSAAVAHMVSRHQAAQTWTQKVDLFITPSAFAREKFVEAGLPADRIVVKPNFVPDCPRNFDRLEPRTGALFVGRLVPEKGLTTLLAAWDGTMPMPLRIAGDGSLRDLVQQAASRSGGQIQYLGHLSRDRIAQEMETTSLLIMASEWYETFGLVICEAMLRSLPVIASDIGCLPELIQDGITGLLFRSGDHTHLTAQVFRAASNPEAMRTMALRAYEQASTRFTSAAAIVSLLDIYSGLLRRPKTGRHLPRVVGA